VPSGSWHAATASSLPRSVSSAWPAAAPLSLGTPNAPDDWGDEGTGPRALAHALLTDELGRQIADVASPAFEREVIADLPWDRGGEEWTVTGQQMRDWWHTRRLVADVLGQLEDAAHGRAATDDDDDPIPDERGGDGRAR
jgi:hypothetical protein